MLKDTLSRVGTVVSWRLVLDKDTGKPKGFGFAEYLDHDSAASAVRNLNDTEFMGRKLRVDWSNDGDRTTNDDSANASGMNGQAQGNALPPLPQGVELPAGVTAPDQISRTLLTLTPPQLLDIISQMKGLVMSNPAQATSLLQSQPQLAYAIFQALLSLELVDTSVLGSILEQSGAAAPVAPTPIPPHQVMPAQPPQVVPPPMPQAYPPQYQQMQQQYMPTPPMGQPYMQPPPQAQAPPPVAPDPSQAELIKMVMNMSQADMDRLDPAQRSQLMALKQQWSAMGY